MGLSVDWKSANLNHISMLGLPEAAWGVSLRTNFQIIDLSQITNFLVKDCELQSRKRRHD